MNTPLPQFPRCWRYATALLLLSLASGRAADPAPAATPAAAPAAPAAAPADPGDTAGLRLNFQNAPIGTVLEYLSQAAGFVIMQDTPVSGTITLVSQQPLSADEAEALLRTVLSDRGYAVIRNERVLRIIKAGEVRTRDLPVCTGYDPAGVPKTDEVVTQIIPMRHTTATKMVDTLKALMPAQSNLIANEDSNALVLTDTRANIRHLMEIIQALDTAVASILDVKVIALRYADAADTAAVINKVFTPPAAAAGARSGQGANPFQFFARMRGGAGGGGFGGQPGGDGSGQSTAGNEAKQTASYVAATADQRANAVVVTAPTEMLAQVQDLVTQLDVPSEASSVLRVFPLQYADATEIANLLAGLYPSSSASTGNRNMGGFGNRGFPPMMAMQSPAASTTEKSERKLAEATVVAVADTRTNAVIVSASAATMSNIEVVVKQLDATPVNVPTVYIYHLDNADLTQAKTTLEGMFDKLSGTGTTSNTTRTTTTNRGTTGTTGGTRSSGTSGQSGSSILPGLSGNR